MCLYEYDEEKHMEMERREHYERGLADGEKRGKREGKREEAIRGMQILVKQCQKLNQSNETITQILMDEYNISEQEAKKLFR